MKWLTMSSYVILHLLDGNVNYEEFVTMLLHKKPTQDAAGSGSHLKRKSDAGSSKSRTTKFSEK